MAVGVGSDVGVSVGSAVGVAVGVSVGSAVDVLVIVGVGESVGSEVVVGVSVGSGSGVIVSVGTSVGITSATAVEPSSELWQPDINSSKTRTRADSRRVPFFMIILPGIRSE